MHPLVRDLYKRVIHAGRDYPTGLSRVREVWKAALRNPRNCPSCYNANMSLPACENEIRRAVAVGRKMVKEMIGVTQLKKYRAMKLRYSGVRVDSNNEQDAVDQLELQARKWR